MSVIVESQSSEIPPKRSWMLEIIGVWAIVGFFCWIVLCLENASVRPCDGF